MPEAFADSDLIISRSGASTVAEVTAAGRPSLLIPFPYAADDHQRKNAQALETRGAALLLDQKETSGEDLAKTIRMLEENRNRLDEMAVASKRLAKPNSTEEIVKMMKSLVLR
jgi:UDP-N-acetylglucosamine--N-acetylmuramyl-(pentapeptide) pyrophosphoryl-undecaprenol N-acetylglucosamine transferase